MALLPEEQIERIKREVGLVSRAEAAGVEVRRHGSNGNVAMRCLFHAPDETPSMILTPSTNLWRCCACGAAGNVIQLEMKLRGVGFREAAEALMAELGPESAPSRPCPFTVEQTDAETMLAAARFYNAALGEDEAGLSYLGRRGLRSEELVERFAIGIANRTLGTLIPEKAWAAGGKIRARLQRLGLWRESGHEALSGSIVVPMFSEVGEVVQMYGRKINDNLRVGTPKHLYLARPLAGIWNREAVGAYKELLLCEAAFDAMTAWLWGLRNVTFTFGVEGLTDEMIEAMRREGTERVVFLYDGDGAGDRGSEKHGERLVRELGIECFRARLPRGHDVNSYARSVSDATDALSELVRRAEWMGKGLKPVVAVGAVEESEPEAHEVPPSLAASVESPASAVAPDPALEIPIEIEGDAIVIALGDRRYRVRGLEKNGPGATMKMTLRATRRGELHVDTFDLNVAKARKDYATQAADELGVTFDVVWHDLGRVWLRLEQLLDERARGEEEAKQAKPSMTDEEREEAMAFWRDPNLLERVLCDFERCGVVGEQTNKLVGFLASVSRLLDTPLGVIIQSSSAAGKTALMEAVLAFVPEEERVKYSAVTGQSLFYMSEQDLRHKVLALVEEEGAERAAYALKLLKSEGELAIASTGKDPQTGRLVTHEYRVEGPVALLLTTTAIEVDEELQNRCIVLTVDEGREQTRAIHRQQRERWTLEGIAARRERERIVRLHRNAQRLLQPLEIHNPWGRHLTFLDEKLRTRRDHDKYLVLIAIITLVHQHQREIRTKIDHGHEIRYIEVTLDDIALANRIAHEVLGRSLDELAPQTRRLLEMIEEMVRAGCEEQGVRREEYRFSRRAIREYTGWSDAYVRVHLEKLVDLEYVLVHRGGRGQSFVYELLYDGGGKDGRPYLTGLLDVEALRAEGTTQTSHGFSGRSHSETGGFAQSSHGVRTAFAQGSHNEETGENDNSVGEIESDTSEEAKNAHKGGEAQSYIVERRSRKRAAGTEGE